MYIESVPNRSSPPAILLRESWRENGRVRKRTLANLSKWPPHLVDSVVAPAQVSPSALDKARSKASAEGLPVHSFQTLLADLATICSSRIVPALPGAAPVQTLTRPTALQARAFQLLGIRLMCTQ